MWQTTGSRSYSAVDAQFVTFLRCPSQVHSALRKCHTLRAASSAPVFTITPKPCSIFIIYQKASFILYAPLPFPNSLIRYGMASCDEATQSFVRDASGYAFHNSDLLREALDTTGVRSTDGNRRLAMIGEARLKDVVLNDWYPTGTTKGVFKMEWNIDCPAISLSTHTQTEAHSLFQPLVVVPI